MDDQIGGKNKSNQHLETASDIGERPKKGIHSDELTAAQELLLIILFELLLFKILPCKGFNYTNASQVFLKGSG